ncbi:hypothetical protein D3C87_1261640 [compost metagenome]
MADQRLGVDAAQFFLAHGEGHHRHVLGLQAGVAQFLVERHVGVAVDRRDHGRLAALRELLDVGDDGLVVAMSERGVDLFDVLVGHALALQERAQDLVGRARVHVVGAEQEEALGAAAFLAHQVFHGRDGLLVRRGTGVEHVFRHLLALVLHRVEQQRVQFLVDREHGLARYRGPAPKRDGDLVLRDQLTRLFGEQRPVGGGVHHHRLELAAEHAAALVDLVDGHQRHILERGLGDGHRARQRMQDADLDRILRLRQQRAGTDHRRGGYRRQLQHVTSFHCSSQFVVYGQGLYAPRVILLQLACHGLPGRERSKVGGNVTAGDADAPLRCQPGRRCRARRRTGIVHGRKSVQDAGRRQCIAHRRQ